MAGRVLLKISGVALQGNQSYGIEGRALSQLASRLIEVGKAGYQVAVVLGGGNLFRGLAQSEKLEIERAQSDEMGMVATIMNGLALASAIKGQGGSVRVLSSIVCGQLVEPYSWRQGRQYLEQGEILLLVAGTGHPYFTTDTAAALRAAELKAEILIKATTLVDGIYDRDPLIFKDAKKYDRITYDEYVEKKLGILDLTAATLCMTQGIAIRVCNASVSFLDALSGKSYGTLIADK